MIYDDRREAGRQLARQLRALRGSDPLILALPRGGVEVGYELALALKGELDLWIVRKLGVPGHEEFGMGALSEGGGVYLNRQTIARLGISDEAIATVAEREAAEIERRVRRYRGDRPQPKVTGRTVVLVDDGIATGGTVRAALQALRELEPRMLILAVPVAPPETLETLRPLVDELVCGYAPADFMAVGEFYRAFPQTSDEEVIRLLEQARRTRAPNQAPAVMKRPQQGPLEREVRIPIARTELEGTLQVPGGARGIVLFAHGSGSSRFSPRNRFVADVLRRAGLGTLLIDLLTPQEEGQDALTGELRFDIPFLASRLVEVSEWMTAQDELAALSLGLFGSSTGAAAALVAAALWPERIAAVVSRGGRPDLAGRFLPRVRAPTLLLVGSEDHAVLELNEQAFETLGCEKRLRVVAGATHLFEEPGTLEEVARLAARWFQEFLGGETQRPGRAH